ncbi:SDR family oxidoreductase [Roseivivax sp. GX 12232]|uniref:SDR family oxidoreductase n=1 Tax=Roseivivax sp. GX 12232 TaxID=2900547 RepID=UPI001E4A9043|nr:SDR family oxidoreductase [Roseivivax sp. GX 12232]MCE0505810.1 SDR family oxidoreductase [Roseivivax sp. GX 12232]
MSIPLTGKSAIVTGAAGGIGAAVARRLAAGGAQVLLVDRNAEGLAAVAAEIGAAARVFPADITSEADMARMAELALEPTGRIDILVAAAGILRVGGTLKSVADTSFEEWKTVIDVNLTGTFLSNRAVLAAMLAQKEGDIVNISSVSGKQGRAFDGPYASSKFGILGLSESLAEEVQREGVRVQTVLPDAVDTGLWSQSGTAALKPRAMLSADHVAEYVDYLVRLPREMFLFNSVVAPVPQRRKRGKGA